jgi:hypothetical protein
MSTRLRACFNGCSFTWGDGFPKSGRELFIYDRLVSNHFGFDRTNVAIKGSGNYTIFVRTAELILSGEYDIHFVQWSALNRIWLSPGPNVYYAINNVADPDYRYRDLYISKSEKSNLRNLVLLLNHDYQNIIDLISYCKILNMMAQQTNTKIFYINGLVPWTDDLNRPLTNNLSESLSDYTKNVLLDFDSRDDDEIVKYFNHLQTKFNKLDQSNWINLFNSLLNNIVDNGPEGHHPGINSHQWMANQIINYLTERKIL